MTTGIHHVTAITRNVQRNADFYAGFLGLRLVKQTGGFEDANQLHLFYGDTLGSPGSVLTFLVWEAGAPGHAGLGHISEIAFAVPPGSIGAWLQRALAAGVPVAGPARELGETVLRLRDPDGIVVKLVGLDMPATAPLPDPDAPTRIRSVTMLTNDAEATAAFTAQFGYREILRDGPFLRMASDTDVIDLRHSAGFVNGAQGTGTFDHVAFRAPDVQAVRDMRLALQGHDGDVHVHDRKYFVSLYVREPDGILYEYATDGPGFAVDETPDHLGETLMIPPHEAARAQDLLVMLPQFALPGQERMPARDLHFIHRFYTPADPDGSVIVLLHGTGGDETALMPVAAQANPRATLLGVRGRSTEEGQNRWFRRTGPGLFDQADIRAEAAAFAAFVDETIRGYGLDRDRMAFLGYSNGANLLAALMILHPQTIKRAILLRPAGVLQDPPAADLTGTKVLMLAGADDPYAGQAPALEQALRADGADVTAQIIAAAHALTVEDSRLAGDWLSQDL